MYSQKPDDPQSIAKGHSRRVRSVFKIKEVK